MGGRRPVQNVQQSSNPWGPQQAFLMRGFNEANRILNNRTEQFYPGQTYASFSPQTEQALNLTEQRALAGSPIHKSAQEQLMQTLGGQFLNQGNPIANKAMEESAAGKYLHGGKGFDAAYKAAYNKIIPDIQSRYNRAGQFGSGLARQAEAQALADAFASQYGQERQNQLSAANFLGNQYGNERQNQLRAMLFAPQVAQMDYNDLAALAGVGAQREGQAQSAIDEAMARHNFNQNLDAQKLAQFMGIISQQLGQEGVTTNQGFAGNRGAGVLGGALGGAGIGANFGPWGAGIGGLLGGLGGLF